MTINRDDFKTDVVGESFYFDTIAKCYRDREALDCDGGKALLVTLVREPNNPHDKNAVGVYSKYGIIGHLSRVDAKKYHKVIPSHLAATVYCRIWTSDPRKGIYGVWLGIDLDNPPDISINEEEKPQINQKRKKLFGLF